MLQNNRESAALISWQKRSNQPWCCKRVVRQWTRSSWELVIGERTFSQPIRLRGGDSSGVDHDCMGAENNGHHPFEHAQRKIATHFCHGKHDPMIGLLPLSIRAAGALRDFLTVQACRCQGSPTRTNIRRFSPQTPRHSLSTTIFCPHFLFFPITEFFIPRAERACLLFSMFTRRKEQIARRRWSTCSFLR